MKKISKNFKITKEEKEIADKNKQLIGFAVKSYIDKASEKHGRIPYSWHELYSSAYIGMINAIRNYEKERGALSSYSMACMHNEMVHYVRENKRRSTYFYVKEDKKLHDIVQNNNTTVVNEDFENIESEIDIKNGSIFYSVLFSLGKREKDVIIKLFGLFGERKYKQIEVANEFNLTQATISKIRSKALVNMKEKIISKYRKIDESYNSSEILEELKQEISYLSV
jgi:RNA polymerase sporulation-specific sigma factor